MVIKKTNGSGGYGMLMGHAANEQEIEEYKLEILKDPRNFIAQPTISLSAAPCYMQGELKPRRIDLRPYALFGPDGIEIVPWRINKGGAKRRIAGGEQFSQGGGSKDTWVLSLGIISNTEYRILNIEQE